MAHCCSLLLGFKALLPRSGYKIRHDSHLGKICGVRPGIWSPVCKHIYWGHPKGQMSPWAFFLKQAELDAKCLGRQGGQTPQTGLAQHLYLTVGTWELKCVVSGGARPKGHCFFSLFFIIFATDYAIKISLSR